MSRVIKVSNREFLEAVFAGAFPNTYTIIASFEGDPYKVGREAWAGEPWVSGQQLKAFGYDWNSGNTYLTVSLFKPDPQTGACRRRKELFDSLRAVMIDDVNTKVDRRKALLQPSAIIETSPRNFQYFLFIKQDKDSRDRSKCEQLIDAMIRAGLTADNSDPGMRAVTRYGRLPVGVNTKAKYVQALGHPFEVRCKLFCPERRYSIKQIAAAFKLDLRQSAASRQRKASATPLTRAQTAGMEKQFAALVEALQVLGLYKRRTGKGPWHEITCPWVYRHTSEVDSGTAISEPTAENQFRGGFRCHHGHCADARIHHVRNFLTRALTAYYDSRGRAAA